MKNKQFGINFSFYTGKKELTILLCISLLSVIVLSLLCFVSDNAYSTTAPKIQNGVLTVSQEDLNNHQIIPLLYDWEFYQNRLYTPTDFQEYENDYPNETFQGEHPTFPRNLMTASSLHAATYRLNIEYDNTPISLCLALPEIFSSSKVWIDGELVLENGSISKVVTPSHIQRRVIGFELNKETEIIIQTANSKHYYSGLYSPPLIGTTYTITHMIFVQLCFYGFLCFIPLGIGFFAFTTWMMNRKNKLFFIYGCMCLSFSLYASYPFLLWFGGKAATLVYLTQDFSFHAIILCFILLNEVQPFFRWANFAIKIMGIILLSCSFVFPFFVLPINPNALTLYCLLCIFMKIIIVIYLIFVSFFIVKKGKSSAIFLVANAFFGFGLLVDMLFGNTFEPIYLGRQLEYSSFIAILLYTIVLVRTSMKESEKKEQLSSPQDFRSFDRTSEIPTYQPPLPPRRFVKANSFPEPKQKPRKEPNPTTITAEPAIDPIPAAVEMDIPFTSYTMPTFHTRQETYTDNADTISVTKLLSEIYQDNLHATNANGIHFILKPPMASGYFLGEHDKMLQLFQSLIHHAITNTAKGGQILLSAYYQQGKGFISISDTGCGATPREMTLHDEKEEVIKLGGDIYVQSTQGQGTTITVALPSMH